MMKLTVTPVHSNTAAVQGHCDEGAEPQSQTLIFFLHSLIWPSPWVVCFQEERLRFWTRKLEISFIRDLRVEQVR